MMLSIVYRNPKLMMLSWMFTTCAVSYKVYSTFHSPTDSAQNPTDSRNSAGIDRIPAGILSIPCLRIQKTNKINY
jgi:hypothetical protein